MQSGNCKFLNAIRFTVGGAVGYLKNVPAPIVSEVLKEQKKLVSKIYDVDITWMPVDDR